MPGIAVKSLDTAGGAQLAGGQSFFFVDDQLAVVVGDPVTSHGKLPHAAPVMVQGSPWMTLDGKPVCRSGDLASCGHASTGRSWFSIA